MSRTTGNESSFATAVLNGLGAPVTQSNLDFIERWITREGGGGDNNPLNTTQQMSGSTLLSGNTAGVQNYSNLDVGVQATVKTLTNDFYPNIVAALRSGNAEQADAAGQLSHDLSTWSGGGYTTLTGVAARPTNSIGGGGQSSGSGLGAVGSGKPLSGQDLIDYAEQNFPQYAYLLHDPEVGPILVKAAQEGVSDPNILAGMLRNTNWWRTTTTTSRDFNKLMADDPVTANQAINNKMADIDTQAWSLGVKLTPQIEHDLAVSSMKLGWTSDTLTQQIVAKNKTTYTTGGQFGGAAALDVQSLKQMYNDYGLPLTDETLNSQMQQILSGKANVNAVQQKLAQQAATLYSTNPQLAKFLSDGEGTTRDWADPYIQKAASTLGISAKNIDITAPMWAKILHPATDPNTGKPLGQAMSLDQWETTLRNDPQYGFDSSINGVQQGAQLGAALGHILGTAGV
jgi:hypothetical protein